MPPIAAIIPDRSPPKHLSFIHACFAEASSAVRGVSAAEVLRSRWPDDQAAMHILQRAAVAAASTTVPDWAGVLASSSFAAFLADLAPASAASRLIDLGLRVSLEGSSTIRLPGRSGQATAAPWVAEGGGIPVSRGTLAGAVVGPARKLGTITVWTEELDRVQGAAKLFEQLLREDVAAALDLAYFSDQAGSAAAHAGLLAGVAPLTASSGSGTAAMQSDLVQLAAAVSGPGSSGEVVFVMARGNAATAPIHLPEATSLTVLGTSALAAGEVVAIDPKSIVHATDKEPDVSSSNAATLHMSDAPTAISTPGAPATVAAPAESMFQMGKIALRVIHDVAFAKRRPDAVAWISAADWSVAAVEATGARRK